MWGTLLLLLMFCCDESAIPEVIPLRGDLAWFPVTEYIDRSRAAGAQQMHCLVVVAIIPFSIGLAVFADAPPQVEAGAIRSFFAKCHSPKCVANRYNPPGDIFREESYIGPLPRCRPSFPEIPVLMPT